MTKKELAEKIAKEQNLDATKLMRLTVAELQKMDLVVQDEGADILGGDAPESPIQSSPEGASLPETSTESSTDSGSDTGKPDHGDMGTVDETEPDLGESGMGNSDDSERPVAQVLLGYDPISGEPVYH